MKQKVLINEISPGSRFAMKNFARPQTHTRYSFPWGTVLSYVVVGIAAFLYLFPLFYLINIAFKSPIEYMLQPMALTQGFHLDNFVQAWERGNYATYLANSILYTVTSTTIALVFSIFAAFPIARGYIKWGSFFYAFFLAAIFLPNPLIPQFQLILNMGLYNTQLGYILINSSVGLGPFLIAGYLRSVPKELDEAASIDGCGYFRFIFTIIVPLIKPILVTVFLLGAINVWNDIIGPIIYFSDSELFTVSRGLFTFYGQYRQEWTVMAASIILVSAPIIILYLFLQRYFMDGALAGAVK